MCSVYHKSRDLSSVFNVLRVIQQALSKAGFKIEKVIHQQNKRSGESNVANPYGTSASDFYIRCVKSDIVSSISTDSEAFENYIVDRAEKIILSRGEPTPYQILFNGLLAEISRAGFDIVDFDMSIQEVLKKHMGTVFVLKGKAGLAGDLWWVVNENKLSSKIVPLSQRVEDTVRSILSERGSATLDEIIGVIFTEFPNGLTPDIRSIVSVVGKYAYKASNKWIYNGR